MKPGPSLAAQMILSRITISAPPKSIIQCGAEIGLEFGWYTNASDAAEALEKWAPKILARLRRELDQLNRVGRFCPYAFNSSSSDLIQGSSFVEPSDPPDVKAAKEKRAQFGSYLGAMRRLRPREFEALCAGILNELGVREPVLTPYSADEGLDFYGRLPVKGTVLPGLESQMSIWMIGQAKHYTVDKISTPDIRDLVGAVTLAKARAFGSPGEEKYADLAIRVCDPVFYLFFTTSNLSSDAWRLLDRSGVIGMDGQMLSAFLADHEIAQAGGVFDDAAFTSWLRSFQQKPEGEAA
jgi:hypothetical protein